MKIQSKLVGFSGDNEFLESSLNTELENLEKEGKDLKDVKILEFEEETSLTAVILYRGEV